MLLEPLPSLPNPPGPSPTRKRAAFSTVGVGGAMVSRWLPTRNGLVPEWEVMARRQDAVVHRLQGLIQPADKGGARLWQDQRLTDASGCDGRSRLRRCGDRRACGRRRTANQGPSRELGEACEPPGSDPRAYLTLIRYADDSIAQVLNDRAWLPGRPSPSPRQPDLATPEMSNTWPVWTPQVSRLQRNLAPARSLRTRANDPPRPTANAGIDPKECTRVVWSQSRTLRKDFHLGDLVVEAADAQIAQMRSELGAVGDLPRHALPTLQEVADRLTDYLGRVSE